jgi:hypothetical protein
MNLWDRFSILTGRDAPRLIATCVDSRYGEFDAELPGGAVLTVVGAGTVGQKYFILKTDFGWRQDGDAPSLPFIEIEI